MHQHKRHKATGHHAAATPRPETPMSLYKQAVRLVQQQPCGDVSADAVIQEKLTKAITLLEAQQSGAEQTVAHSLDLELPDEPLYLLASAHLQLGLLHQRQDRLDEAEQQFRAALRCFPRFVACLSALGQVLKAAAASAASLAEAEQVLTQAVEIAQQLSEEEGGLLVESNKGCAAELEAADAARAALAMLLCQSGRAPDAAEHLKALGFKFRLSQEVLCYVVPKQQQQQQQQQRSAATPGSSPCQEDPEQDNPGASSSSQCSFMQVVDSALPAPLLQHLQHVFRPGADFWREHSYGRVGYFSYFFPMGQADSPSTTSMHQLARYLQALGRQYFPDLAEAKFAEFWAHSRRHSSGHQLHFDSDDEGQGGVRHPIITAIVYLSDNTSPAQRQPVCRDSNGAAGGSLDSTVSGSGCCGACGAGQAGNCVCVQQEWVGGPTLLTDQLLCGPLATQGWLAYPATNRVVFFDGRYLHGVVPGRGPAPSDGRRCTLMMAFWRDLKCRTQPGQGVGACMPMPDPAAVEEKRVWQRELRPLEAASLVVGSGAATPVQELQHVSAVWQAVDGGGGTAGAAYQCCFQGF